MSEESSFQKRLEAENQALRNINQLTQRWENRITARRLRLAQRFLDLELHILLNLRVIKSGKCWGVLLEKEIPLEPVRKENEVARAWSERTMLVDAVKLVNSPQIKVPTFVWFEEINRFYSLWPDTVYKSSSAGFVTSFAFRNRECVSGCNHTFGNDEHMAHEVVESGSQIMCDISYPGRNIGRAHNGVQECITAGGCLRDADAEAIRRAFSFLSVSISDNDCQALYSQDVGCQITEVLFGPLNFYADQNDSFVGRKQRELLWPS